MMHQLEPSPGPGSYNGIYTNSSFFGKKQRSLGKRHQQMGQGRSRWHERDSILDLRNHEVGPGSYDIHPGEEETPAKRRSVRVRNSLNVLKSVRNVSPSIPSAKKNDTFTSTVDETGEKSLGPGTYLG